MAHRPAGQPRIKPAWWTLILIVVVVGVSTLTWLLFNESLYRTVPVTLTSDRAGLVMDPGSKVKLRGVQVGTVGDVAGGGEQVSLALNLDPAALQYIPVNVSARIRATTAFGAKYVDLIYPSDPSRKRLTAGSVIESENVSTEVNTVFQNLTGVLKQIQPEKLNAILTALAEGLRGQGDALGQSITDFNQWLLAVNPRMDTIRIDWQAFKDFADTYRAVAPDLLKILDASSSTSETISSNASALDSMLLSTIGFARSGIDLLAPVKDDLVTAIKTARPTTDLLLKYNPMLTCLILGGQNLLDTGYGDMMGGNGRTAVLDAALLFGDDPYRFPDNLPVTGARGGYGGKPSCGPLPDVARNFPVPYLVSNTGWGTGLDQRPNPGIGHPWFLNYFPTTRAVPQPPTLFGQGPPAIGPVPYLGAPPYGAPLYAPDGTPLYPGLPPAPPPGAPKEPGPRPGSEPFVVPHPAQMNPTPAPPIPDLAVPAP